MDDAQDRDPTEAADANAAHEADRPPTPDEERTAEQVAAEVDPASAEHYRQMAERGANAKGEGEIVPE